MRKGLLENRNKFTVETEFVANSNIMTEYMILALYDCSINGTQNSLKNNNLMVRIESDSRNINTKYSIYQSLP